MYAVEFSHRSGRDLINVAKKRTNVIPIIEDARHPHKYRMLMGGWVWAGCLCGGCDCARQCVGVCICHNSTSGVLPVLAVSCLMFAATIPSLISLPP